ncbi:MAG: bifunctional (p)ppGpp synthetase/guanosine-3',5'-bis(diphosphate) 3'-pyrophosphohydrolase, partial [Candidatus Eisenbacteria bacterium]|nr:bifunctional (p)ppGpp synthetase/guanosine-3',5'-bis(diphosphate) 3'-pyrophosphohydrolase [Candidatus Eisenbacteria bacterium]
MTDSEFVKRVLELDPRLDADLVKRAHDLATRAHAGQTRESGDPYIVHAEMAAEILAQLQLDSATVAAGLLHDVVEESDMDLASIGEEFGEEIAELVDGVTKITGLKFESREREQAENFRKMLLSVVKDVRVILIKLADRLHNMRTISHLTPAQIERISRETREIYAPLAGRFGMARIQRELEDLSFRWLEPDAHRKLERALSAGRLERDAYIEQISRPIREALEREGVGARIFGRSKHLYSIHKKMLAQDKTVDEIYDLVAMRIITSSVSECYRSLGTVHTLYTPIHDRIKDFIATPKLNGYRALHTTVIGPRGQMVEIQIRTEEMHEQAEIGIAAHWTYKEGSPADDELRESLAWVRQLLEGNIDLTEADEFLELLKVDLYRDEIFVFTPNGDLKHLPKGSTPIDFAYSIHTDVGNHCAGARIDGRMVSLKHSLENGATVEVVTSEAAHPSRDWLGLVVTSRARSKIRHYLREQADGESVVLGRRIIDKELKKLGPGASDVSLDDVAQSFGLDGTQDLAAAVGRGDIGPGELERKLSPAPSRRPAIVKAFARKVRRPETGVRIKGIGDIMLSFAKCCQPV